MGLPPLISTAVNSSIKRFETIDPIPESKQMIEIDHEKGTITLQPGTYHFNTQKDPIVVKEKESFPLNADMDDQQLMELLNGRRDISMGSSHNGKNVSEILQDTLNNNVQHIDKQDKQATKILRDLKPGEQISVKDIKKIYGKNWKKSLACTVLPGQIPKKDKNKAKMAKKSRQKNRRRK